MKYLYNFSLLYYSNYHKYLGISHVGLSHLEQPIFKSFLQ